VKFLRSVREAYLPRAVSRTVPTAELRLSASFKAWPLLSVDHGGSGVQPVVRRMSCDKRRPAGTNGRAVVFFGLFRREELPSAADALPGRAQAVTLPERHLVSGHPLQGPYPDGFRTVTVGMGCFWGVERLFWQQDGVRTTAVGYAGGHTPNPRYEEVCSGRTGHDEVVRVVFDPEVLPFDAVLKLFWENHDPTQGMRQGADRGTQYRSALFVETAGQLAMAEASRAIFQAALTERGRGEITTEIRLAPTFYFAEDYHQQYLVRNPAGYCSLRGTGARCTFDPETDLVLPDEDTSERLPGRVA